MEENQQSLRNLSRADEPQGKSPPQKYDLQGSLTEQERAQLWVLGQIAMKAALGLVLG